MSFDVRGYLDSLTRFGMKPGLLRIERLLKLLGDPHEDFATIHVGGTNGKGSISAMLASILEVAGYKVGLFTSPHLVKYNERYRINGVPISDADLETIMQEVAEAASVVSQQTGGDPTEFEIGTALAFLYFKRMGIDIALIEVGLGGRFDSTNVITPQVAVIGQVSIDHTNILGDTIEGIAREKAGIFKPGRPVVLSPQTEPVRTILLDQAGLLGCPATMVEGMEPVEVSARGCTFHLETPWGRLNDLHTNLLGQHQIDNAATAVMAAMQLTANGTFSVGEESIRKGLEQAAWPGRLDLRPGKPRILLDGVHNVAGAHALQKALQSLFPNEKIIYLLGILGGKDVQGILQALLPLGAGIIFTKPKSARIPVTEPDHLVSEAAKIGFSSEAVDDAKSALEKARQLAGDEGLVCISGSLYLVGEVMGLFEEENTAMVP